MKEKMAEERNFGRPVAGSGRDGCLRIVGRLKDMITRDGELDSFKIPAHFRIVAEMHTTVTGKPQRFRMREQMAGLLSKRRFSQRCVQSPCSNGSNPNCLLGQPHRDSSRSTTSLAASGRVFH